MGPNYPLPPPNGPLQPLQPPLSVLPPQNLTPYKSGVPPPPGPPAEREVCHGINVRRPAPLALCPNQRRRKNMPIVDYATSVGKKIGDVHRSFQDKMKELPIALSQMGSEMHKRLESALCSPSIESIEVNEAFERELNSGSISDYDHNNELPKEVIEHLDWDRAVVHVPVKCLKEGLGSHDVCGCGCHDRNCVHAGLQDNVPSDSSASGSGSDTEDETSRHRSRSRSRHHRQRSRSRSRLTVNVADGIADAHRSKSKSNEHSTEEVIPSEPKSKSKSRRCNASTPPPPPPNPHKERQIESLKKLPDDLIQMVADEFTGQNRFVIAGMIRNRQFDSLSGDEVLFGDLCNAFEKVANQHGGSPSKPAETVTRKESALSEARRMMRQSTNNSSTPLSHVDDVGNSMHPSSSSTAYMSPPANRPSVVPDVDAFEIFLAMPESQEIRNSWKWLKSVKSQQSISPATKAEYDAVFDRICSDLVRIGVLSPNDDYSYQMQRLGRFLDEAIDEGSYSETYSVSDIEGDCPQTIVGQSRTENGTVITYVRPLNTVKSQQFNNQHTSGSFPAPVATFPNTNSDPRMSMTMSQSNNTPLQYETQQQPPYPSSFPRTGLSSPAQPQPQPQTNPFQPAQPAQMNDFDPPLTSSVKRRFSQGGFVEEECDPEYEGLFSFVPLADAQRTVFRSNKRLSSRISNNVATARHHQYGHVDYTEQIPAHHLFNDVSAGIGGVARVGGNDETLSSRFAITGQVGGVVHDQQPQYYSNPSFQQQRQGSVVSGQYNSQIQYGHPQ